MIVSISDFILNRKQSKKSEYFGKVLFVYDTCSLKSHKVIYLKHPIIHMLINKRHTVYNSYGCDQDYYTQKEVQR